VPGRQIKLAVENDETNPEAAIRAAHKLADVGWVPVIMGTWTSTVTIAEASVPGERDLKGVQYVPRVIVTDKSLSYGVAQSKLLPKVEHRQSRYLNNRAENSHRSTRCRERQMQRLKSPRQAQDFLSAHAFIHGHFNRRRHLLAANSYRTIHHQPCRLAVARVQPQLSRC